MKLEALHPHELGAELQVSLIGAMGQSIPLKRGVHFKTEGDSCVELLFTPSSKEAIQLGFVYTEALL